ncbi:MAG: alpha/beta fold hydrolase [Deltaproteobacteria bacterium]|nr:alpha/beta fold hydrolase [Deltaproteobacteria bacterium]
MNGVAHEVHGAGPSVVLVHSFPLDRGMWDAQRDALVSAGLRVLTLDLPGFGHSPLGALADETPSLEAYVDAVVGALDAHGMTRAAVVGLSLGGYVALALARRHAGRIASLVLADTRAAADNATTRAGRVLNMNLVKKQGPRALVDKLLPGLVAPGAGAQVRESVREMAARQAPEGVSWALLAMRDRPDATAVLPTITAPTLVLCGALDAVTPPEELRALAGAIPGAVYRELPGAGHLSNLEAPALFNAELVRFLVP